MPKYRTKFQNSKLHGIAGKLGLTKDDLHEHAYALTDGRTEHTSDLTIKECDQLINYLENLLPAAKTAQPSRRTIQHHRQKAAVKTLATPTHIDFLNNLARQRGMTKEGLQRLCLRMIKLEKPRTSNDCNKIIEAIKAMNARDASQETQELKKEAV